MIISRNHIAEVIKSIREEGKRIVFTNGCFDLLHPGHIRCLGLARKKGDCLIVGVNSDASVKRIKGPTRPILPEWDRAEMLDALSSVDIVVLFDEDTPAELINDIIPDVLVKGGDWPIERMIGADVVKAWGGDVLSLPFAQGYSTSRIIDSIKRKTASIRTLPGLSRERFPLLLTAFYPTGIGVEVGVQRGDHAVHILSHWPGHLYLVDPWKHYDDGNYVDDANCSDADHELHRQACLSQIAGFGGRAIVLRKFSTDAAELFDDESLDFVYLDANHDYKSVCEDIRAWYPKIRVGGLMSGHDYTEDNGGCFGVEPAINEFVMEHEIGDLFVATEEWPTWYFFKGDE